ncbi:hypothetical protein FD755_015568 [Muntiacus reevesi]|uniref:Small ribosomal subunit protein uS12 n=1 Tax=Muntiacus reevesi TaxID=9886 RepID=A0A5N3XK06_MUNRE|nr:hypothetical protein FD755_015568 [Muntiacus reevesi]
MSKCHGLCQEYKKAHLGTTLKAKPFRCTSHAKRIFTKYGKKSQPFVSSDGCVNFIKENDEVLVAGFGCKGHAVGDIHGVHFKAVKVASVSFLALHKGKKDRPRS